MISSSFSLERKLEKSCRKTGLVHFTLPSQGPDSHCAYGKLAFKTFLLKTSPGYEIVKNFTGCHIFKLKMNQEVDIQLTFSD